MSSSATPWSHLSCWCFTRRPRHSNIPWSLASEARCPSRTPTKPSRSTDCAIHASGPEHARNDRRTSTNAEGPTLGDFFRIQRGIATGSNKFFVLERSDAVRRGLPEKYLRPILPSPRHLKATIIDADEDDYPLIDLQLCVIDCDLPEHVVETKYPAPWAYL